MATSRIRVMLSMAAQVSMMSAPGPGGVGRGCSSRMSSVSRVVNQAWNWLGQHWASTANWAARLATLLARSRHVVGSVVALSKVVKQSSRVSSGRSPSARSCWVAWAVGMSAMRP